MRIDVRKYLFIGPKSEQDQFFRAAQDAGIIQFIEGAKADYHDVPLEVQNLMNAIKVLRGLPTMKQEFLVDLEDGYKMSEEILDLKSKIENFEEEDRVIKLEMARIEVFGDFSLEDVAYVEKEAHRKMQFFFAKQGLFESEDLPEEVYWIDRDHGLDYFVALNHEPRQYDDMIEMRFENSLSELRERHSFIQEAVKEAEQKLKAYSKYNGYLHHVLTERMNRHNRNVALSYSKEEFSGSLFAVTGWVPENKVSEMETLVQELDIHFDEIAIEDEDSVPTYLENKGASRLGEDLVQIYDTPSVEDKDPSIWVLCFFALFFAMIIGDGGYGLVFLGVAAYLRYKTKKITAVGKRVFNLLFVLCTACVLWGVLTHSFFGFEIGMESPFRSTSLVQWLVEKKTAYHIAQNDEVYQEWIKKYPDLSNVQNPKQFLLQGAQKSNEKLTYEIYDRYSDNVMMELAILIGVIHTIISLVRYLDRNWPAVGWVFVMVGGYLFLPKMIEATTMVNYVLGISKERAASEGQIMLYGGLAVVMVLALIRDRLMGFLEITNLIQIFGDVLSYLRLYALALAGAMIGSITNEFAMNMNWFAGILLFVVGHGVNMILAVIGGVIHGLRLNFIEWYHYSFEGGGKQFAPLQRVKFE